ncbi:MAG: hypothetical protein LAT51_12240 [Flavobacteriaceae bacterium]|nr:hypothetical protein [Flavobacteriaceae bacterium]
MERETLIKQTFEQMKRLPDYKLKAISEYVEFLSCKVDDELLLENIKELAMQSHSFEFLNEEEDLYSVSDVKERYNEKG